MILDFLGVKTKKYILAGLKSKFVHFIEIKNNNLKFQKNENQKENKNKKKLVTEVWQKKR